jgi:hypothetical protein
MATPTVVHPTLRATSLHPQAATPAAVRPRPTTAATAPTRRLLTITVRRTTTILRPTETTQLRAATLRLRTGTIRRRVPSRLLHRTRPRAAVAQRRAVTLPRAATLHLAIPHRVLLAADSAAAVHVAAVVEEDSTAAAVDPTPVVVEAGPTVEAAVGALTVTGAITNPIVF